MRIAAAPRGAAGAHTAAATQVPASVGRKDREPLHLRSPPAATWTVRANGHQRAGGRQCRDVIAKPTIPQVARRERDRKPVVEISRPGPVEDVLHGKRRTSLISTAGNRRRGERFRRPQHYVGELGPQLSRGRAPGVFLPGRARREHRE